MDSTDDDAGPTGLAQRLRPGNSALGRVMRQLERLERIEALVHAVLPQALRDHVVVAALDSGHLRLLTTSSARATQLRFQQRSIQAQVREFTGEPVQRVDVLVRSRPVKAPGDGFERPANFPPEAAKTFREMAAHESDPGLRRALERLGQRST